MRPHIVTISRVTDPDKKHTKITYEVLLQGKTVGSAEVEYFHDRQQALIHNLEIEHDCREQGIGSFVVGWIVTHTPYLVGTSYERESAYEFWAGMRHRFKGRMLPPFESLEEGIS
ncbi:hypothetical protein [Laribacter hongkongensis]|uniref:hypothetical protein n=1 Tax=Laribacter hongkongensis TaxID=168471 RepID=UPI001EFE2B28|nr:hypothetical protein [Laribacter hongkongensis]MCG9083933.1 hypothetical protein [Laribacter hongkongensis]